MIMVHAQLILPISHGSVKTNSSLDGFSLPSLRALLHKSLIVQHLMTSGRQSIQQVYASESMARMLELRLQLQTTKKGGMSCTDYLQKMRSIADQLRSIGSPVSDHDLLLYALSGLGPEYDPFVLTGTSRSEGISFKDLHGLLLSHEFGLEKHHLAASATASVNL